jgi:hypothetical protein
MHATCLSFQTWHMDSWNTSIVHALVHGMHGQTSDACALECSCRQRVVGHLGHQHHHHPLGRTWARNLVQSWTVTTAVQPGHTCCDYDIIAARQPQCCDAQMVRFNSPEKRKAGTGVCGVGVLENHLHHKVSKMGRS